MASITSNSPHPLAQQEQFTGPYWVVRGIWALRNHCREVSMLVREKDRSDFYVERNRRDESHYNIRFINPA